MSEMIIADGILYERVFPRYEGDYEPAPQPAGLSLTRGERWIATHADTQKRAESRAERILGALAGGPRTQTELADALRVSNTTICRILTPLIDSGEVAVDMLPPRQGTMGRPQIAYRLVKASDL